MSVRMLAFHLTDRCNLNCQHCVRDPALRPTDLPLVLIERVLDQARFYGIRSVALTGGEPFIHPEIAAILDAIAAREMKWHAVTNASRLAQLGQLLDENPARRGALARLFFSLDGADEATHDSIRGQGSFREVMRGVALCTAWGVPFVLQMVVNARNESEIEAFALQAAQLGAERASFAWLQPTGTHLDAALYLSRRSWKRVAERIRRLSQTLQMPVGMPEGFASDSAFHVCESWQSNTLHVDVHGNLSLCCQLSGIPGSRTDALGDLRSMPLVEGHRRMVDMATSLQRARIDAIAAGALGPWDEFPCNWCLKQFGKPHWDDAGAVGPGATRDRWRGAWTGGDPGTRDATKPRVRLAIVDAEEE